VSDGPGETLTGSDDPYVELVLRCAERVPRGRATTYGAIAEAVGEALGRGGPRTVGSVMSRHGATVPWWRVVRADGSLPDFKDDTARQAYLEEGTPLRRSGAVDLARAFWRPTLTAADRRIADGPS
jgi:alkylated DNA nucleotide flippase Atl1